MLFTTIEDGKKQTFEGFVPYMTASAECPPKHAVYIGIALVEGDTEIWWLRNRDQAVEELQRYYRMTWGREMVIKIFTPV